MYQKTKSLTTLLLALIVAFAMLVPMQSYGASKYVKSLSLTKQTVSVKAGKSATVTATVKVKGAASKKITVATSSKAIATVSKGAVSKGKTKITIKGVKKGTATITVKTVGKNSKKKLITKKIKVTVGYANVTGLTTTPSGSSISMLVGGQTQKITAKVSPLKANPGVTYSSSNTGVATVSTTGVITPKAVGTATITVKTKGTNSSGKALTKKYTVKVDYQPVAGLSATVSDGTMYVGDTLSITKTVTPSTADPAVTYTSSNEAVATVNTSGKITAKKEGSATITVATKGRDSNGDTITKDIPITVKNIYSVTKGSKNVYINFTAKSEDLQDLKDAGYTVEGSTVSANVLCQTATYTFDRLPETLEQVKAISLDSEFGPVAAAIAGLNTYQTLSGAQMMYDHPIYDVFEYLNGPNCSIANAQKSGVYYSMKDTLDKGKLCYFEGATPSNRYTPTEPYKFTLYVGPYYIPAKNTINGPRPETYMVLISFAGDDSERYCDVYHSSDGNWYMWDQQWTHLISTIKDYPIIY